MAGQKCRKSQTSKGERRNVSKATRKLRITSPLDKMLDIQRAFRRGITDPWVTIENPVKKTNEPFVKVRYSVYTNQKAPKRSVLT